MKSNGKQSGYADKHFYLNISASLHLIRLLCAIETSPASSSLIASSLISFSISDFCLSTLILWTLWHSTSLSSSSILHFKKRWYLNFYQIFQLEMIITILKRNRSYVYIYATFCNLFQSLCNQLLFCFQFCCQGKNLFFISANDAIKI